MNIHFVFKLDLVFKVLFKQKCYLLNYNIYNKIRKEKDGSPESFSLIPLFFLSLV